MPINFVKSAEKKQLLRALSTQFGIDAVPYLLLSTGKQKIRGFSGSVNKDELKELSRIANVEIVGMYLFKQESGGRVRLSLDATQVFKDQIISGIVDVDDSQLDAWLHGEDVPISCEKGMAVVRHKQTSDLVGCGISDGTKVINHVPRERRIRRSS